jgi:hypothetical protein
LVDVIDESAFGISGIQTVRVAEGNRSFRVSGASLSSFDGSVAIHYFGEGSTVRVDADVEVLCSTAFNLCRQVSAVEFATGSKLRLIEGLAFSVYRPLQSLFLPSFVAAIDGSAFWGSGIREIRVAEDNRHFRVSGDFLLTFDGRFLIQYFGRDQDVRIDRGIEVLCRHSFALFSDFRSLAFDADSKLRRIEFRLFSDCISLYSLCLPASVCSISDSAFIGCRIRELRIAEGNRHFRASGDFLLSFDGRFLIRYFGGDGHIRVDRDIEVICPSAFPRDVLSVEFGADSKLRRTESRAFSDCQFLHSICIPSLVDTIAASAFRDSGICAIRVCEGNRHFRVSGDCLLSFDGRYLVQYFGRDGNARIDREVEVVCRKAFRLYPKISTIEFAGDSKLRRIEPRAFAHCRTLQSIWIPRLVEAIDGSAFENCEFLREIRVCEDNRHFRVLGDFLVSVVGGCLVRYFGRDSAVTVPGEITVLSEGCFAGCSLIRSLSFEVDCQLRRIDSRSLSGCSLRRLCIPRFVDAIDGSAFADSGVCEIRVAAGNRHFRVFGEFLVNSEGTSSVRYFGRGYRVLINREIEMLGPGSFASCHALRTIEFESGSKLRSIGKGAFEKCSKLYSISIPPSTQVLSDSCFRKCPSLQTIRFDWGSKLSRIESGSLSRCSAFRSVFLPVSKKGEAGIDLSGLIDVDVVWYESD